MERKFRNSTFSISSQPRPSACRITDFLSPQGDSRWGRGKWLEVIVLPTVQRANNAENDLMTSSWRLWHIEITADNALCIPVQFVKYDLIHSDSPDFTFPSRLTHVQFGGRLAISGDLDVIIYVGRSCMLWLCQIISVANDAWLTFKKRLKNSISVRVF